MWTTVLVSNCIESPIRHKLYVTAAHNFRIALKTPHAKAADKSGITIIFYNPPLTAKSLQLINGINLFNKT
jgi:hypothetical protein